LPGSRAPEKKRNEMRLRVIHILASDGIEHVFAFLILDEGVEFEYAPDAELIPEFHQSRASCEELPI
jgi:hypothetical protein